MNTVFLFLSFFVYVNADVYTITVEEISPQAEEFLSVSDTSDNDIGKGKNCSGQHTEVRKAVEDTPLYDGLCRYKNGDDIIARKSIMFCNTDITDVGGTAVNILYNALGLEDQQPCPIEPETFCGQQEFKLTSGNFEGIFESGDEEIMLEIEMSGIINAKFRITKKEGLPVPEEEEDENDEANGPLSEAQQNENEGDEEREKEEGGGGEEGGAEGEESSEGDEGGEGGESDEGAGGEESSEGGGGESEGEESSEEGAEGAEAE